MPLRMRFLAAMLPGALLAGLLLPLPVHAQDSFYCTGSSQPSCLAPGATICPSEGRCVAKTDFSIAAGTCPNDEFVCTSHAREVEQNLKEEYNALVEGYNALAVERNEARSIAIDVANSYLEYQRCATRGNPALCPSLSKSEIESMLGIGQATSDETPPPSSASGLERTTDDLGTQFYEGVMSDDFWLYMAPDE